MKVRCILDSVYSALVTKGKVYISGGVHFSSYPSGRVYFIIFSNDEQWHLLDVNLFEPVDKE